jgi:hypothetical protein
MNALRFAWLRLESLESRLCFNAPGWVDLIDNPYFPLVPGTTLVYRGSNEDGESIRTRLLVTDQTKVIQGVTCTVVRDREFVDGELVEDTRDWYAQDAAGNVWYFGEKSQEIEDGQVVGTEGSWEAGVNGAKAAIVMLARPAVGDEHRTENAPGIAEDDSLTLSLKGRAVTNFGTFGDCLLVQGTDRLSPGDVEHKWFAPGIGMVKEQEVSGGSDSLRLAYVQLAPSAFADKVDNPFFPLNPGTTFIFRGESDGVSIRNRTAVTTNTKVVAGVNCVEVRDQEFEDNELVEDTRDWYAQDKAGNVWYFGEDSREIEDGQVVSTEGSWEAGVDGAIAGIIMRAKPGVGDAYKQEVAVGIAEDEARVISYDNKVKTPFATFGGCLKTEEFTKLEPGVLENKFYAPGIGFLMSQGVQGSNEVLRLSEIIFA